LIFTTRIHAIGRIESKIGDRRRFHTDNFWKKAIRLNKFIFRQRFGTIRLNQNFFSAYVKMVIDVYEMEPSNEFFLTSINSNWTRRIVWFSNTPVTKEIYGDFL